MLMSHIFGSKHFKFKLCKFNTIYIKNELKSRHNLNLKCTKLKLYLTFKIYSTLKIVFDFFFYTDFFRKKFAPFLCFLRKPLHPIFFFFFFV